MSAHVEVSLTITDPDDDSLTITSVEPTHVRHADAGVILQMGGVYLTRDDARALAEFLLSEAGEA